MFVTLAGRVAGAINLLRNVLSEKILVAQELAERTASVIVRKDTLVSNARVPSATMPAKTMENAKSCRMKTAQRRTNACVRNMRIYQQKL